MSPLLLALRIVHLLTGMLWVGFAVFLHYVLAPALEEIGPEGGRVMGVLQRRGLMTLLPVLALATILSGGWLYWQVSGGGLATYVVSAPGAALALAAVAATVAYLVGILVTRPSMMRAGQALQQLAAAADPDERERLARSAAAFRRRGGIAGGVGAVLLIAAAVGMAVARYL